MADMFELLSETIQASKSELSLSAARELVLGDIRDELNGHLAVYAANPVDLMELNRKVEKYVGSKEERWLFISNGLIQVLIGTNFLAEAYTIKNHDWSSKTVPVLVESGIEVRNIEKTVVLKDWLNELFLSESQKTS